MRTDLAAFRRNYEICSAKSNTGPGGYKSLQIGGYIFQVKASMDEHKTKTAKDIKIGIPECDLFDVLMLVCRVKKCSDNAWVRLTIVSA